MRRHAFDLQHKPGHALASDHDPVVDEAGFGIERRRMALCLGHEHIRRAGTGVQHFFVAGQHHFDRPRVVAGVPQGFDRVQECHDAALHIENAGAVRLAVPDGKRLPADGAGGDSRIHVPQK